MTTAAADAGIVGVLGSSVAVCSRVGLEAISLVGVVGGVLVENTEEVVAVGLPLPQDTTTRSKNRTVVT